ncbi:hypothetical protein IFM89_024555 [Coptis chinensis]|uniref:RRM domain-containing protein n=1 Tax=Coptis chinensis TaxID=261450 RepID=A0A835MC43_9MAGN|nr:hypothetical protein IFM89_024555 [Coptis chinensis]
MDDEWRRSITNSNMVMSIKIIRNKITQQPEGYCFVEFASHGAAERVLQTYNDTLMPGTDQPFRLNWASFGIGERCPDVGPEHSIFVGDLASDVTDYLLQKTFRAQRSGPLERPIVLKEGYLVSKNRYNLARKAVYPTPAFNTAVVQPFPAIDNDITNTTIFVGGLDPNVTEEELRQIFTQFGDLVYAKTIPGKGCGFVQFGTRQSAEVAIQRLNGTMIGQQTVRLSWGRSMTAKQLGVWAQPSDPHQWNGAYYGYGQGYDAYGYGAAPDPSLYSYGAYARYGRFHNFIQSGLLFTSWFVSKSTLIVNSLYAMLNYAYLAVHGSAMVGRPLWLKTSALYQQA